jgi:MoaA/NifB/PqqE/SkfB family radical SAM enzyme
MNIIDQLKNNGVFQLHIAGGEPFLRPDLQEIVLGASEKGLHVCLLTNGSLIKEDDMDWLNVFTNKFHGRIQISLDSQHSFINDKIRGETEKILKNIDMLIKNNLSFNIGCVISSINVETAETIINYFYPKIKMFHFMPVMKSFKVAKAIEIIPTTKKLNEFFERLQTERLKFPDDLTISNPPSECEKQRFSLSNFWFPGCCAAKTRVDIDSNFDVYACSIAWNSRLGSLNEKSFKEIWNSQIALQFRGLESYPCD